MSSVKELLHFERSLLSRRRATQSSLHLASSHFLLYNQADVSQSRLQEYPPRLVPSLFQLELPLRSTEQLLILSCEFGMAWRLLLSES